MNRKATLDSYLQTHNVPENIAKKINPNSFLTSNFAYNALRIGNSIGDLLNMAIELILLEKIATKFNLILNTTEHAELHSSGTSDKDLDILVKGALLFENTKHNKKQYKDSLKNISDYIHREMNEIIESS